MENPEQLRPVWKWLTWPVRWSVEIFCLFLAATTGGQLCHIRAVLRRNPFGWSDAAVLAVAAMCAVAAWGFFRLLADLLRGRGLAAQHPGHVAWWLAGGIWVTAAAADVVVESSSHNSNAVSVMILLGLLLAIPLMPVLLVLSVLQTERRRADWRAWAGCVIGCAVVFQCFLFHFTRR